MKICFILQSLQSGGIERVAVELLNRLAQRPGVDTHAILLHEKPAFFKLSEKVITHSSKISSDNMSKWKYTYLVGRFIPIAIKEISPDVIVSNGEWINSFCWLCLPTKYRSRLFMFDHSNPFRGHQSPFYLLDKIAYPRAKGVLVLSRQAREKIRTEFMQTNVYTLDNPVNLMDPGKAQEKQQLIISVGRLSKEKGHDVLIKAFSQCKSKNGWNVAILGEGSQREELQALIDQLGLTSQIKLLGNQSDVAYYYRVASIFVLPSWTENFPLALIEAMSASLPTVMTDCISWREEDQFLEDGKHGFKVPLNSISHMADAIDLLIENPKLRDQMGSNAISIRDRFERGKVEEDLLELFVKNVS